MKENINFKASVTAPDPKEVNYWIDLKEDPTGAVIKVYKNSGWAPISGDTEVIEQLEEKIDNKADKSDTYNKKQVDAKVASVYRVRGTVANFASLPEVAVIGDVYNVDDTGANYVCISADPAEWDKLSETVDLTNCISSEVVSSIVTMTQTEYNALPNKNSKTLYLIYE